MVYRIALYVIYYIIDRSVYMIYMYIHICVYRKCNEKELAMRDINPYVRP